jgi:hypothetical protein
MNDWNIQSRSPICGACEQPFADKQTYHTILVEETEGMNRSDVCQACWEADARKALRAQEGFVSHWQGVYEVPPPVVEPIQKENAESLLRKLIALDDPQYVPAAYILAVMLERKRLLKVKEEWKRDGQRVFVYEHPGSGDVFTVTDPGLQLDQLESVQREVSGLLEHGLSPAPSGEPVPVSDEEACAAGSRAEPA